MVKTDVLQVWQVLGRLETLLTFASRSYSRELWRRFSIFCGFPSPHGRIVSPSAGQSSVNVTAASPASPHFLLRTCCNRRLGHFFPDAFQVVSGLSQPWILFLSIPLLNASVWNLTPLLCTLLLVLASQPGAAGRPLPWGGTFYWLSIVIFSKPSKVAPPALMSLWHLCDPFSGYALLEMRRVSPPLTLLCFSLFWNSFDCSFFCP